MSGYKQIVSRETKMNPEEILNFSNSALDSSDFQPITAEPNRNVPRGTIGAAADVVGGFESKLGFESETAQNNQSPQLCSTWNNYG
jgi:hypothetical protein